MTVLLMVRHGPTAWTAEHRLQGRTDVDLSSAGIFEAVRLRTVIDGWEPRTVVVSPLSRTRSTATRLSALVPVVDERWAEAGLGEWEGKTPAVIGADYARWREGALIPPGGEPLADLRERVAAAAIAAAERPGPVLVVTHGGVIRAALAHFVGLTADRIEPVSAPSLTVLDVDPSSRTARLLRYNVTA